MLLSNVAKNLSPVVVEKLAAARLPNSYIHENRTSLAKVPTATCA